MARTGHWLCKLEGYPDLDTDQLRLKDVVIAEKVCGLPYTMLDPRASTQVAIALFVLMLVRQGVDEDEAIEQAENLHVQVLHGAFTYVEHPTESPEGTGTSGPPS